MGIDAAIKVIYQDDNKAVIGGYGVVFGAADLVGDTFMPDTDYGLTRDVKGLPVYYDHNLQAVKGNIGQVLKVIPDDTGLWFEAEIEKSRAYAQEVLKLVETGRAGYSTGAVSHLVERLHNNIKSWPIGELSITTTPADPRTVGVQRLKAITYGGTPMAEDQIVEGQQQQSEEATQQPEAGRQKPEVKSEVKSNEPRIAALEDGMKSMGDQLSKLVAALEQSPALRSVGYVTDGHVIGGKKSNEVKTLGNWLVALARNDIKTLERYYPNAEDQYKLNTSLMSGGGALVPQEFMPRIMELKQPMAFVRPRSTAVPALDQIDMPTLDQSSTDSPIATAHNYYGGATFKWMGEDEEIDPTDLGFYKVKLRRKNLGTLIKVSNKMLQATPIELENYIADKLAKGSAHAEDRAFLRGQGGDQPLGIYGSGVTKSINITDAAPTRQELLQFLSAMPDGCLENSVWLVHNSLMHLMEAFVNFVSPGQQGQGYSQTILSRPYIVTDKVPNTVALGGIALMDLSMYYTMNMTGIELAMSSDRYFEFNQTAWRVMLYTDGAPAIKAPLTIEGGDTLSPFVVSS